MGYDYSFLEKLLFVPRKYNKSSIQAYFKNKTVLITGASFGIGESLALLLAQFETNLILVARTEEKLISLKQEIKKLGSKSSTYVCDLSNEVDLNQLLIVFEKEQIKIDVLVLNAGKSIRRSLSASIDRYHDFKRTIDLNYLSAVKLALYFIPILENNKGHIVSVSSASILLPPAPYWAAYQASKSAFDQWLKSCEIELNQKGVFTSTLYLPLVKTRMIEPTLEYARFPAMAPNHVAFLIANLVTYKNRKYNPWWLFPAQISALFLNPLWLFLFKKNIKKC